MKSLFRNVCFAALTVLCAVALAACEDDDTKSGDLQLFYPTVVDIGPSMNFVSGTPTYYGPAPSDFSIAGVTLDDESVVTECFSIGADTGMVSISNTDDLDPGTYKLTIACRAGGGLYRFKDIFVVRMVPATPEAIEVSEPTLVIPYAELETSEASVTVTPVGESVSILGYALVQAEGEEYFAISSGGVVTLNANFSGEIMPGDYPLPIRITTYAGAAVYENLLTARITSEPLEIRYPSVSGRMEYNMAFQSPAPTLKGSPDEVVWAIKKVTPAEGFETTDKIRIDPATGVISVDADSELPIDASYTLDLTVSNSFGSTDFEGAYTLTVIEYIAPIEPETFSYAPVEVVEGTNFKAPKTDGFVGDEASFSLGDVPAALAGQLTVDEATGEVSSLRGITAAPGVYQVPVRASNMKSETPVEVMLTLTVIQNPNMFTTFSYGNNLGLDWKTNADQHVFDMQGDAKGDTTVDIPVAQEDFAGREVTFKMTYVHNNPFRTAAAKSYVTDDGTLHLTFRNDRAGQIGVIKVDATIGTGETAITRSTYLFTKTQTAVDKVVVYKPLVFRVNPRTGGYSEAPTIDADKSNFMISLKRNIFYYNLNGPSSHVSGQLNATSTTFIYRMWGSYFGSTVNAGSREPMSYYELTSGSVAANLTAKIGYIDCGTDFKMYIPANKWMLDGAYANGVLIFQAPYTTTGTFSELDASGTNTFIYMAVWFDENF